tara:strand:- start:9452 stop:10279 length:828 start_codon:yes stop_codon:yes gene_type:complete
MRGRRIRTIFISRDIELRIVSLITRAREFSEDVIFVDLGSNDQTVELANEVDCRTLNLSGEVTPSKIAKLLGEIESDDFDTNMIINVTKEWRLKDLPLIVNRAREPWDFHLAFISESDDVDPDLVEINKTPISHFVVNKIGLDALLKLPDDGTVIDLEESVRARILPLSKPVVVPQRQSLAKASRFAQLFYWMLETGHPLILFGIPGLTLFILGWQLSDNVVDTFNELNSTSMGVTLGTIALTLLGLFGLMISLILYIMGKQVEHVQNQYAWNED